ncbi:helix-turn-helix domain-containing protein [Paludibacterium denitrificans]|uniref:Helix-turn-helix domain-containing protein n=1 Tax=Paludibacterium denitrificans TaxID=2675226 RepID=A0A844GE00_9NEIS|nr:XRE family transcriptional regulator [Paludibacterium denitrificans]MTD33147.1 helix-turn-helix domain-containing protein [Paludibacterium denitrificans]
MADYTIPVIQNVSANLKQARQSRQWSQEKLAANGGVSRRMLVNIEAGESNVSIATLDKLAAALGLTFAQLVRPPASATSLGTPLKVWQGAQPDSHGTLLESLLHHGVAVELWVWQLAPQDSYHAEADAPGSHELVYVMEGELTLTLRGTSHTLRPGQSFSFASDAEYHYRNLGDRLLRFTKNMVMTGPY